MYNKKHYFILKRIEDDMANSTIDTKTIKHTILRAEGFSCPSCVTKIEKRVGKLKGVYDVMVRFASARVEIDHDETVSVDELIAAVAKAGYTAKAATF